MPEVFFCSLGVTELSGKAAKASREAARRKPGLSPTSTTRSDAPGRWRARRPFASKVGILRISQDFFEHFALAGIARRKGPLPG